MTTRRTPDVIALELLECIEERGEAFFNEFTGGRHRGMIAGYYDIELDLEDSSGKPLERAREIRDQIREKVQRFIEGIDET